MRLGLVYLPSPDVSRDCVAFAESLVTSVKPRMVIGPDALPHISLLHVETDNSPQAIFEEAREVLPTSCSFDILGLGLLRYDTPYMAPAAGPGTMAWLVVPCTAGLRSAERVAVSLPVLRGILTTTGNGDDFQPHLTIAVWDGLVPPSSFAPPATLVPSRGLEGRLALGAIGPNGVYMRTLFSA